MIMEKAQKEKLKKLIEFDGNNYIDDMEAAKENLNLLAESVEETFGVKPAIFKKMCKVYWKANIEEESAKFEEFNTLYREILGD
jgi:hypothetical protein